MPIVFYTFLIDAININAVHLHNAKLTDLFIENESRTDCTISRIVAYKRESLEYFSIIIIYHQFFFSSKDRIFLLYLYVEPRICMRYDAL